MHGRLLQGVVARLVMQSVSALAANLPDATASYVRTVEGRPPTRGKLYVSNGRLRTESELPGGTMVLIVKTMDESGLSTTTFENVVIGKPDAKLFRAPAGCKRMPVVDESAAPK